MAFQHDAEKHGEVLDKYAVSTKIKFQCDYESNSSPRTLKMSMPSKKQTPQLSGL